jgi:DNA polymerase/3'-5' exonuclease PolX
MREPIMENRVIARRLREYARYLEGQDENLYRVKAYRNAAAVMESLRRQACDLFAEGGRARLEALPGIGEHLSYTLEALIRTGEFHTMHSPREFLSPQRVAVGLPVSSADSTMTERQTSSDTLFPKSSKACSVTSACCSG